jgi:hypothetical protein
MPVSAPPRRSGAAASVVRLQRSLGNAAVGGLLARAGAGGGGAAGGGGGVRVLARDASLGDAPLAKRKQMAIDTRDITWSAIPGGLPALFTNPDIQVSNRSDVSVTTRLGGQMAQPANAEAEAKLRRGLERMGKLIFNLNDPPASKGGAPAPDPVLDSVHFQELDLSRWGGVDGRYRFSVVTTKAKSAGAPAEVDLIIERVQSRAALASRLDPKRRAELQARFDRCGQKRGGDDDAFTADPAPKWQDPEWDRVLQALELIPEPVLTSVSGIVWMRGSGAAPADPTFGKEDGSYNAQPRKATDPPKRKLTLYGSAFANDDNLIKTIVHEVGHAISLAPSETGGTAKSDASGFHAAAGGALTHAITTYGHKSWSEDYAEAYSMFLAEPDTLKLLRPELFDQFQSEQDALAKAAAKAKKP